MALSVFFLSARLLFRRMGILLVGNVLWILFSLPLVTWPAATGALFYLVYRVVQEERAADPHYARPSDFWEGFRRYWPQSSLLALLDLVILVILVVALRFYGGGAIEGLRWVVGPVAVIALAWLGAQMYLFPLLIVAPDKSPVAVLRTALLTAIGYPAYTLTLLVLSLLLAAICFVLAGPVLLLLFAMLAMVQTMALRIVRIQRGEIPPGPSTEEEKPRSDQRRRSRR